MHFSKPEESRWIGEKQMLLPYLRKEWEVKASPATIDRLASLTSIMGKLLEGIIANRIESYSELDELYKN